MEVCWVELEEEVCWKRFNQGVVENWQLPWGGSIEIIVIDFVSTQVDGGEGLVSKLGKIIFWIYLPSIDEVEETGISLSERQVLVFEIVVKISWIFWFFWGDFWILSFIEFYIHADLIQSDGLSVVGLHNTRLRAPLGQWVAKIKTRAYSLRRVRFWIWL